MWKETNPRVTHLLQSSLQSFRHEQLLGNCVGIPKLLQHGNADENVPVFHSRRMLQLMSPPFDSVPAKYVELEGKGHWFDGIMSTAPLSDFYASVMGSGSERPALPFDFSLTVANPADMGSRGGLVVDQLRTPDQTGKIEVKRSHSSNAWSLKTSNIRRFHFVPNNAATLPADLTIDKHRVVLPESMGIVDCSFVRSEGGLWEVVLTCQA